MSDIPQVITEIIAGDALGLGAAARKIPSHRGDGRVNPSTIWRWIVSGSKAADGRVVRLEAARVGGRWLTSSMALARFWNALTPVASLATPTPSPRTPSKRQRSIEAAHRKLATAGC